MKKVVGKKGTVVLTKNATAKSAPVGKLVKLKADELAEVRVGIGSTLNMGNYESLRLGVDISLPCSKKEIDGTFKEASGLAEKYLERMIKKFKLPSQEVRRPGAAMPGKRTAQEVLDDDDEIDQDELESDNPDDEIENL